MGDLPAAHVVGHEHADVTGGWLRPAVFGAMDGLVSNAALIAGVAGGTRSADGAAAIVLAGLAGLRSAERRVGEECVRTCSSRWSPCHSKPNNIQKSNQHNNSTK